MWKRTGKETASKILTWKDHLVQQKIGTAIGTGCSPPCSGLYIEQLTEEAFNLWQQSHPDQNHNIQNWCCLIDNGFGIWTGPLSILKEFVEFLNGGEQSMKFTMETTCPRVNCPEVRDVGHECKHFLTFLHLKIFVDKLSLA